LTAYNNPFDILVTGDSASPGKVFSLEDADGGSGCADVMIAGEAQRLVNKYYSYTAHDRGLIASYLDGHVTYVKMDGQAAINKLVSQINNAHGDQEPYLTRYVGTTTKTLWGPTVYVPSSAIVSGGWFYLGSADVFKKGRCNPGFDITAGVAGGSSLRRLPPLDMTAAGVPVSWNDRGCQVATTAAPVAICNISMNFLDGKGGDLHVIWGSWTDNSNGNASLKVIDNTNGVTYDAPTYPDLTFSLAYNSSWTMKDTVFKVGSSKSLTLEVRGTVTGRGWFEAAWVEPTL
jgi:hypothetical protein